MRVASWHPEQDAAQPAFEAHLHGRSLEVAEETVRGIWTWEVRTPHGVVLAHGMSANREAAEEAAEDEATAVHPPTSELLERLLS
jgi:hypothetical protein